MTQTMLERAARALYEAGRPETPTLEHWSLEWRDLGDHARKVYANAVRAVLMAVRVPSEAMSQAVRTTEGWEDMIDFVLNEGEPK